MSLKQRANSRIACSIFQLSTHALSIRSSQGGLPSKHLKAAVSMSFSRAYTEHTTITCSIVSIMPHIKQSGKLPVQFNAIIWAWRRHLNVVYVSGIYEGIEFSAERKTALPSPACWGGCAECLTGPSTLPLHSSLIPKGDKWCTVQVNAEQFAGHCWWRSLLQCRPSHFCRASSVKGSIVAIYGHLFLEQMKGALWCLVPAVINLSQNWMQDCVGSTCMLRLALVPIF